MLMQIWNEHFSQQQFYRKTGKIYCYPSKKTRLFVPQRKLLFCFPLSKVDDLRRSILGEEKNSDLDDRDLSSEEEDLLNSSRDLSDAVELLEWRSQDVAEYLEEHETELLLFIPLHHKVMKRVQTLQDDLVNYVRKCCQCEKINGKYFWLILTLIF